MSVSVVVPRGHGKGDYHEPVWLGHIVMRDSAGRRHRNGGTRFAVVKCNNTECPYEALVNAEVVAAQTKQVKR